MILRNNKVALRQVHDSFAICAIYFFYTVIFNILIDLALIYISITRFIFVCDTKTYCCFGYQ